ncbi:MAG: hypothetical protein JWP75_26, partial [Frondihabitans sp.]|nr:hypothetical protein [Frondihabitans sp.]
TLTASVQGSDRLPYECSVVVAPSRGDYVRPTRSRCSCPVAEDCKHVAAALIQSNAVVVKRQAPRGDGTGAAEERQSRETDWKAQFTGLTGSPEARAIATKMGLQFELRQELRASRGRWDPPKSRAATSASAGARHRLAVRPVLLSDSKNWIRGNLTWSSLPYQLNRLDLGAEQHRWFGQFAALHRSARDSFDAGETGWLLLDTFGSPLLWPLLTEAARLGISFVTGKKETNVTVADEARIMLDVERAADGGLTVAGGATIDGTAHGRDALGIIGDHGVYAWKFDPQPHFVLAPTATVVGDDQRRFVTGDPIVVPASDAEVFLRDFYPKLHDLVDVVSGDNSVSFPEILPPRLVVTATFKPGDRLDLFWHWDTAGGSESLDAREAPTGLESILGGPPAERTLRGAVAAEFSEKTLAALQRHPGVRVDVVGDRPDYRELNEAPHLTLTTVETDQRDWFDLGVLVTVEGRTIPFGPLFTALSKKQAKLLLVDRTYLSLKHPAFDELRRLIEEAESLDEWEAGLRINRYQASLWKELEELADETIQADAWRQTVGGLLDLDEVDETPVPAGIEATLRPYQAEGFSWLAFLYHHGLGGVLADDMGLGKTVQTLALVAHVVSTRDDNGPHPFLVVAPTSVVSNWVAEAERFTPGLVVRAITETEAKSRDALREVARSADIVVTSYALFRLDFAAYQAQGWAGLILDEAQFVKNRTSKAHRCAVELDAPFKLAITGTPLENSLTDLWALLRIVAPGLLSTGLHFSEEYVKPIASGERPDLLAKLRRRIRPLMMRRTKELVASDLPAKQEQVLRVDLTPAHRELYDLFLQRERQKLLGLVDDLDRNRFIVFRSLTLLRLLALDPALVDEQYEGVGSSKLDVLLDELDDVVAGGHRALVFSQFTSYLSIVAARLTERGIDHEYLDGSTRRRPEVIDRFREGTAPVFLISLKAGGFGLNLTEAGYVFLLDPWWNPATESQAIDRTHRIGQTANVMVYRLIATDTIEEKVMKLQAQKAQLFDAVMVDEQAAFGTGLTADDIRGLLDD